MDSNGTCLGRECGVHTQRRRRRACFLCALVALMATSSLIACAPVNPGAQSATGSLSHATTTPSRARPGGMALNSCSNQQAPADAGSFRPDVIVSQVGQGGGSPQTIALARGQRLEIRLGSTFRWELTAADSGHVLASTSSEGWYNSAQGACIWRFTAVASGSARLSYTGAVECPPLEVCPALEQALNYLVTVG